jgi:hypothetical protein
MLFHVSFGQRPNAAPPARRQPLDHAIGVHEVTRVHWIGWRTDPPSPELAAVIAGGHLGCTHGDSHLLVLGFDGETRGACADLRPSLPLVLRW